VGPWFSNPLNLQPAPTKPVGTNPAMAPSSALNLHLVALGLGRQSQQAQQLIRAGRVPSGRPDFDKPAWRCEGAGATLTQGPRFVLAGEPRN